MKDIMLTCACTALFIMAAKAQNPANFTNHPASVAAAQQQATTTTDVGKFTFNETDNTYDYGIIPEGPKATHNFHFVNTGKAPILITNAQASCGCTSPEFPKEPILPGKEGIIAVTYTTEGHLGNFEKSVHLTYQTGNPSNVLTHDLYIKGIVKAAVKSENKIVK